MSQRVRAEAWPGPLSMGEQREGHDFIPEPTLGLSIPPRPCQGSVGVSAVLHGATALPRAELARGLGPVCQESASRSTIPASGLLLGAWVRPPDPAGPGSRRRLLVALTLLPPTRPSTPHPGHTGLCRWSLG